MKFALLVPFLVLTACDSLVEAPAHAARPQPDLSERAGPNPAYWQFFNGMLAMIPDESDAADLTLSCVRSPARAPTVSVTGGVDNKNPEMMRLTSGAISGEYPTKVEDDEVMGETATSLLQISDPVLKEFARTGNISHFGLGLDAVTAKEREAIKDFFASCR